MGEHLAFWIWLSVLVLACCLITVGLVFQTIGIYAGPGGFIA
jgi:hypothetical protein